MTIPPGVLVPGYTYSVASVISSAAYPGVNSTATVEFTCEYSDLEAYIRKGNREVGADDELVLDGSLSRDPDQAAVSGALSYAWSCQTDAGETCRNVTGGKVENFASDMGLGLYESELRFPSGTFSNGTYIFSLFVTKDNNNSTRNATTSVTIDVSPGSLPDLSISPLSKTKYNPAEGVTLALDALGAPSITSYSWTKTDGDDGVGGSVWYSDQEHYYVVLDMEYFTAGQTYTFKLTGTTDDGVKVRATIDVPINEAPRSGVVKMDPVNGTALTTAFAFTASGWTDDSTDLPLSYKYKYLKGPADVAASEHALAESSASTYSPVYLPQGEGINYTVHCVLYVTDTFGYSARTSKDVTVLPGDHADHDDLLDLSESLVSTYIAASTGSKAAANLAAIAQEAGGPSSSGNGTSLSNSTGATRRLLSAANSTNETSSLYWSLYNDMVDSAALFDESDTEAEALAAMHLSLSELSAHHPKALLHRVADFGYTDILRKYAHSEVGLSADAADTIIDAYSHSAKYIFNETLYTHVSALDAAADFRQAFAYLGAGKLEHSEVAVGVELEYDARHLQVGAQKGHERKILNGFSRNLGRGHTPAHVDVDVDMLTAAQNLSTFVRNSTVDLVVYKISHDPYSLVDTESDLQSDVVTVIITDENSTQHSVTVDKGVKITFDTNLTVGYMLGTVTPVHVNRTCYMEAENDGPQNHTFDCLFGEMETHVCNRSMPDYVFTYTCSHLKPYCSTWNVTEKSWDVKGGHVENYTDTNVTCSYDTVGEYALALDTVPLQVNYTDPPFAALASLKVSEEARLVASEDSYAVLNVTELSLYQVSTSKALSIRFECTHELCQSHLSHVMVDGVRYDVSDMGSDDWVFRERVDTTTNNPFILEIYPTSVARAGQGRGCGLAAFRGMAHPHPARPSPSPPPPLALPLPLLPPPRGLS